MTLAIRVACGDDLADIVALDAVAGQASILPSSYRRLLSAEGRAAASVLLAEWFDQPIGFSLTSWVLDEASLLNIVVNATYRRHGVAEALLLRTLSELPARGVRRLLLEVRATNIAARALYGKLAFAEDGVRRGYYPGRGTLAAEDAILMSRSVSRPLT